MGTQNTYVCISFSVICLLHNTLYFRQVCTLVLGNKSCNRYLVFGDLGLHMILVIGVQDHLLLIMWDNVVI